MKILVVGGGGREHTLVWKISESPLAEKIYCAPGNPGIAELAECVDIRQNDIAGLLNFAKKKAIDLTVVGPEEPLVNGIVDTFEKAGLAIFGPRSKAAEIEGSKAFTKYLMDKYQIPTADCVVFEAYKEALSYLAEINFPVVVKADGLAAGKGTFICKSQKEAEEAVRKIMLEKAFGEAGNLVLVEEFMVGEEASIMALSDGKNLAYFPSSQDHKAIFDNDEGPNTGGMGAYAPAPLMSEELLARVDKEIMRPAIDAMASEGRRYRGILYAGLMITRDGPKVVEFNCRLGDPETQVLLPLIETDLVELMHGIAKRKKMDLVLKLRTGWAMCVVLASGGYPGNYEKDKEIFGLGRPLGDDIVVFHAGTKRSGNGKVLTAGGRVLGITAIADDFHAVRERAYWAVGKITFDKAYYRKDIGVKATKHLK